MNIYTGLYAKGWRGTIKKWACTEKRETWHSEDLGLENEMHETKLPSATLTHNLRYKSSNAKQMRTNENTCGPAPHGGLGWGRC